MGETVQKASVAYVKEETIMIEVYTIIGLETSAITNRYENACLR